MVYLDYININNSITWRKEWNISRYESPWGILQKFKFANSANDKDIFQIFGSHKAKSRKAWSNNDRELITMNGLDGNLLEKILGINIKENNTKNLTELLGIFTLSDTKELIKSKLHYCPKCLKIGYHSIFHQLIFFNKCAYHNINLESQCPNCGKELLYQINYEKHNPNSFFCKCGYSFYGEQEEFTFIKKWAHKNSNLVIKLPELTALLELDEKLKSNTKKIYYYNGFIQNNPNKFLKCFLSILDKTHTFECDINNHSTIKSNIKLNTFKENDLSIKEPVYDVIKQKFRADVVQSFIYSYKGLMKHLINTTFKNHKPCIKSLTQKLIYGEEQNYPICHYAIIYITLRNYYEGYNNHWDLFDSTKTKQWVKQNFTILSALEKNILKDIYFTWNQTFYKEMNLEELKWVLNQVLMHLVYNNYLRISTKVEYRFSKNNDFNDVISTPKLNDEIFFIKFPENEYNQFEFHSWVSEIRKNLETDFKLICPFDSIKKRRKSKREDKEFTSIIFNKDYRKHYLSSLI